MAKNQHNNHKRLYFVLIVAVVVLAVALGVYHLATYKTVNHAPRLKESKLLAYNTAMTARAFTAEWISGDMVLVLHSLQKDGKTDSQAEFYIYQLPEGADPEDYLCLHTGQLREEDGLVHMGTLACRLPEENILSAYDFRLSFIR